MQTQLLSATMALMVFGIAFNNVQCGPTIALKAFSLVDCGRQNNDPVSYDSFSVTPDPILVPGTVTVNGNVVSTVEADRKIPGHVTVYKIIAGVKVYIPCVDNVGSCDYDDICALLDQYFDPSQPCPPTFVQNDWPCHCPLPAKTYNIQNLQLQLNQSLPAIDYGDYEVTSTLSYTPSDNDVTELSCVQVTFSVESSS